MFGLINNMYRCISLARVSSDKQEDNTSFETQHQSNEEFAKKLNYKIVSKFSDTNSRTDEVNLRVGFLKSLKQIKEGKADIILFSKADRIGINKTAEDIFSKVYEAGGKLGVSSENRIFENLFEIKSNSSLSFLLFFSNFELSTIHTRIIAGKQKAIENKQPMAQLPFGYKIVSKQAVIVPEQAKIVKRIFFLRKNHNISQIVGILNEENAVNFRDTLLKKVQWSTNGVTKVLEKGDIYSGTKPIGYNIFAIPEKYRSIKDVPERLEILLPAILSKDESKTGLIPTRLKKSPTKNTLPLQGSLKCSCGEGVVVLNNNRNLYSYCNTFNRKRVYKTLKRDIEFEVCQFGVPIKTLLESLIIIFEEMQTPEYLFKLENDFEVARLNYLQSLSGLQILKEHREELIADRKKATKKLIQIEEDEILRVLKDAILDLDMQLTKINDLISQNQETIQTDEEMFARLGVDINQEGEFIKFNYSKFQNGLEGLIKAIKGGKFQTLNEKMYQFGFSIILDHSEKVMEKRKEFTLTINNVNYTEVLSLG